MGKAEPARHLRVVDEHGTVHDQCPGCAERELELEGLQSTIRSQARTIANLRRDKWADAQGHELFPTVRRLFDLWRTATGHLRAELSAADFDLALPHLKACGETFIRFAIHGIADDPIIASKPAKNGKLERYDQWEHLFKNRAALERYFDRAPLDRATALLLEPVRYPRYELNLANIMPDGATPWAPDAALPSDWGLT